MEKSDKSRQHIHVEDDRNHKRYIGDEQALNTIAGVNIDNVLAHQSKEELFADVDSFVTSHGLEDYQEVFRKGALVAQNPAAYKDIPELTDDDRATLEHELTHKWSHPFPLYFTGRHTARCVLILVLVCAIGAACQGWDQTGSNGASECQLRSR
jgi:hypothetical protein